MVDPLLAINEFTSFSLCQVPCTDSRCESRSAARCAIASSRWPEMRSMIACARATSAGVSEKIVKLRYSFKPGLIHGRECWAKGWMNTSWWWNRIETLTGAVWPTGSQPKRTRSALSAVRP